MAQSALQSRLQNFFGLISDIRHSDVFDASYYRQQSLGAKLSPDPVLHYLFLGWKQGLNPSPSFDTRFYVERYRDVRESKANPLKHYMIHGRDEGRLATRSGRIFRDTLHPEFAPLPLFGAPAGEHRRLNVVIDDHTPDLLVVGYLPLMGLASHTAATAGWSLRVIIRSHSISTASVSAALNATSDGTRPVVDITRRVPGPTDDVDATETDIWWATSASSMESLRHLLPAKQLWWVVSADEARRAGATEYQQLVSTILDDKATKVIALGGSVAKALPKAKVKVTVDSLPQLIEPAKSTRRRKTLGVVVRPGQPESLSATATRVLEHALTHHQLDPKKWSVTLLGVDMEPLTFSGSVVVGQTAPATPEEWAVALGSVDALLIVQAGSEEPWCAAQATVPVVSGSQSVDDLASRVGEALSAKAARTSFPRWAEVVAPVVAQVESARG